MRVVQINGGVFGSTGSIMFGIAEQLERSGGECICFSPVTVTNRIKEPDHRYEKIGTFNSRRLNVLLGRITGSDGCFSLFVTLKLIKKIKRFSPDIMHLHNIHGGYVNIPLLFRFAEKHNVRVVWTLHDCWAFTGHCPHYDMIGCKKWQTECHDCPIWREYPQSVFDNSKRMFHLKEKWYGNFNSLTLVTPSRWLAEQVEKSFLSHCRISVINNGIDLDTFKPKPTNFRVEHDMTDEQIMLLGVSFVWNDKKGLDVFKQLSERLDPDKYRIVLVGADKSVIASLPENIIAIERTQNKDELVEIYSAADVFINPTREDTFPTVNIESLACGTPVITFDVGGASETIDKTCGEAVPKDDINFMEEKINYVCDRKPFSENNCRQRALKFDKKDRFKEYVELYRSIMDE